MAKVREEENQLAAGFPSNQPTAVETQEETLPQRQAEREGLGGCERFGDRRGAEQGFFFFFFFSDGEVWKLRQSKDRT